MGGLENEASEEEQGWEFHEAKLHDCHGGINARPVHFGSSLRTSTPQGGRDWLVLFPRVLPIDFAHRLGLRSPSGGR